MVGDLFAAEAASLYAQTNRENPDDQFQATIYACAFEDSLKISPNRRSAKSQNGGDFLILLALNDERDDCRLLGREPQLPRDGLPLGGRQGCGRNCDRLPAFWHEGESHGIQRAI